MYGEGRQDKTREDAHRYSDGQIQRERKRQKIDELRHHGSQTGSEEGSVDIAVHAASVKAGKEPGAEEHGQDVDRIFAEEGETRVDKKNRHGESCKGNFLPAD